MLGWSVRTGGAFYIGNCQMPVFRDLFLWGSSATQEENPLLLGGRMPVAGPENGTQKLTVQFFVLFIYLF